MGTYPEMTAKLVERAMNAWLATDPQTARRLSELEGAVIGLEVTLPAFKLFFFPAPGRVRVAAAADREPHTWIRGSALSLLRFGLGDTRPGNGARLVIEGDIAVGQTFQHILKTGDFDWEELLVPCLGDVAAHELARGLRATGRCAARSFDSLNAVVGEYLQEEAGLVPGEHELREFIRGVDNLRDRVEFLEVRANPPREA